MSDSSHDDDTGRFGAIKRFLAPGSLRIQELLFPTDRLPQTNSGLRQRATRADRIPETEQNADGERPTVQDYHSINAPNVRIPKKIATPIQVESKVCTVKLFCLMHPHWCLGLVRK